MSKIDKIDPRYSASITFISCILDIIYVILYYEDYLPIDTTTFGCVYEYIFSIIYFNRWTLVITALKVWLLVV